MFTEFVPFVGSGNGNTFLVVPQDFCHRRSERELLDLWRLQQVDSVLMLAPSRAGDVRMYVPGADGIWGQESGAFCGNGSRLVARFVHQRTGRHPVIVSREGERFPTLVDGDQIRVRLPRPVVIGDVVLAGGEPHVRVTRRMTRAALLRFCNERPPRVSANQVRELSSAMIEVRTFEHSINRFTACCGTGAASMAFLSFRQGLLDSKIAVRCPGGTLGIEIRKHDVIMTGPAQMAYEVAPPHGGNRTTVPIGGGEW